MINSLLNIENVSLRIKTEKEEKEILKGISLKVNAGEVHAIMGPNGSGKSTFAGFIVGHESFLMKSGSAEYKGTPLASLSVDERARKGIFLSFQHPVEIPGVSNVYLLKAALNAKRKELGEPEIDAFDFLKLAREKLKKIGLDESFLNRAVNEGFSGGEKKRNEILQMLLLEPDLAILDEIDSGLDIDALKTVAEGINSIRGKNRSILIVTHYQRLLDYVEPDFVHILAGGRIAKSGGKGLAKEIESTGYGAFA